MRRVVDYPSNLELPHRAGEERALDVLPSHIVVAEKRYHLGVNDLNRIQLIKLAWMEEVLI